MRAGTVQKRNAFTLIELLVVIAIIVILMALTVGVLSKIWQNVDETKTTVEVSKLAESINLFKGQFGRYPPSIIILSDVVDPGLPAPAPVNSYRWGVSQPGYLGVLFNYSVEYLTSIFPGINLAAGHQWAGTSMGGYRILEGEQCLVYFLGGMRYLGSAPQGFNTDKTNPTLQTSTARLGPFYPNMDESRIQYNHPSLASSNLFPVYKDYYGTPYLYFLARYQGNNNYINRYLPYTAPATPPNLPNDCESITTYLNPNTNVSVYFVPYFVDTVPPGVNWTTPNANFQFFKADTFQIISAGRDKNFGTGGSFNVKDPENSPFMPSTFNPAVTSDMLKANFDNITNFTGGRLVPQ